MKIVLITQWFPPEQAPIGYMIKELSEALASSGHDVTIITAFPNHPTGVVFDGYKKRLLLRERIGNINILRVWLATSANRTLMRRVIAFLTFTVTSAWALMVYTKPRLIFAVYQPLSVALTLPVLAHLKRAKLIFNVQDLHPDVQIELGMIRNPLMIRILRAIESLGYSCASALSVICNAFKEHCIACGARADRVEVIPNWIDVEEIQPGDRNNVFRERLGLSDAHFVVLYAGTVGLVSGAQVMLNAAGRLRDLKDVRIVFVGDGPVVPELKNDAQKRGLENVIFAPFQPRESLGQVQAIADISVVSLIRGKGRASVPSKVLGYMAAARPVLASVDENSEIARMIKNANCGWITEPEDPVKLAEKIRLIHGDATTRMRFGDNGRNFLVQNYRRDIVTRKYVEFFERVAQ